MALGKRKERQGREDAKQSKKQRKNVKDNSQSDVDNKASLEQKPLQLSSLQEDEKSFPRGGADILTPLERKQIQVQATKDVLFEDSANKRPADDASADGNFDGELDGAKPKTSKKKKVSKTKHNAGHHSHALDDRIRVDGLKPKRLVPGCVVLGSISTINPNTLSVDLPNNLRGSVSVAAMSKVITHKLEALAAAEETEQEPELSDDEEDFDLKELFHKGQFLRTCVLSPDASRDEEIGKGKKHIELSIDPRQTNRGISLSDISINTTLQASVISVEDHGLVMDIGLEDSTVSGFMSSKEVPESMKYTDIKAGSVFLCLVTGMSSNGTVIKLSANLQRAQKLLQSDTLPTPKTVKSLLPGLAVEVLVSQVTKSSVAGKIMGSVDAAADLVQSGSVSQDADIEFKYTPGSRVKTRIIFANPGLENDIVGVSLLPHVLYLSSPSVNKANSPMEPLTVLPISSTVEKASIVSVDSTLGVFADVGVEGVLSFVHISRLADGRVDSISSSTGAFRSGTSHRARIVGYNAIDGMYMASFEKTVLEQKYLRIQDIPVAERLQVTIRKIVVKATGVAGLIVELAKGIHGFVPDMHMSDVHLQHPERKFKVGQEVAARVLSVNETSQKVTLTLKKALVSTNTQLWKKYSDITADSESVGTIIKIKPEGAIVEFFAHIKGFLPVSQMSDAFIDDATKHFRIGQTVKVHVLSVEQSEKRLTVSCKSVEKTDAKELAELAKLKSGMIVNGTVIDKSGDDISLELKGSKLKASLPIIHLSDRSEQKNTSESKQIRTGQSMTDLLILNVLPSKRSIALSQKPSLLRDAKAGKFLTDLESVEPDMTVNGFVRNITDEGVFVEFGSHLTGLLHRTQVAPGMIELDSFGLHKGQSITARVATVDHSQSRFNLTMREKSLPKNKPSAGSGHTAPEKAAVEPVDGVSTSLGNFTIGKVTSGRISSIKSTQLNVQLAENVQGRVDISEAFTKWEDIKDHKHPLKSFHVHDKIPVRILGIHDARNHRFLPISHRSGKVPVFELSVKTQSESGVLSPDQLSIDSWYTVFVNNVSDACLWVNISPNVRGRIDRMDVASNLSTLNNLSSKFPVGSALRARVKNLDLASGRIDLSAKQPGDTTLTSFDSLSIGMVTTGRATKITEHSVLVQLSSDVVGSIGLTELSDDFSQANPGAYSKNEIIRVCILDIDRSNKRIMLSARRSKVLSSSLKAIDPSVSQLDQIKVNDVLRGFVKNVTDAGLFISLSYNITAFVRVSELSDSFIKDWKADFEVDKLVTGKVISVDINSKQVQMSLKESVISGKYTPQITFDDLKSGQVITAKVRKVEEFGAFLVVDNSNNVSGLCHRSEMAEKRVPDARKIYEEGDVVKAMVLKIEPEKRRISFGLRASYFEDDPDSDDQVAGGGFQAEAGSDSEEKFDEFDDSDEGVDLPIGEDVETADRDFAENKGHPPKMKSVDDDLGLDAGSFDWNVAAPQSDDGASDAHSDSQPPIQRVNGNHQRVEFQVDHTGDLDTLGPRSADDFERLLLGQRDSSSIWVQYMAFHLQLGEAEEARNIAERALREINIREQDEKLNVWVAYLNLENAYGTDDSIEEVFSRACQYQEPQEMHERLASIYIESGKYKKAEDLFLTMTKKRDFPKDPKFWLNYANFFMGTLGEQDRARALLDRAAQSVPSDLQRRLVSDFAQLEFRCKNGDPERGRTMFERLLDTYPKHWDLWDILIEMETLQKEFSNVRGLFERMASMNMKQKRAKYMFKKWLKFEEDHGDQKKIDHVNAKAAEYVEQQKSQKGARD